MKPMLMYSQANANINEHARHLGQKYMGIRPERHMEEMFKDTSIDAEAGHPVPITNFVNAQCTPLGFSTHVIPKLT